MMTSCFFPAPLYPHFETVLHTEGLDVHPWGFTLHDAENAAILQGFGLQRGNGALSIDFEVGPPLGE